MLTYEELMRILPWVQVVCRCEITGYRKTLEWGEWAAKIIPAAKRVTAQARRKGVVLVAKGVTKRHKMKVKEQET